MSNIQLDSILTPSALLLNTAELLRNLGRFPLPVLPVGLLQELQSRGDAIHDDLIALLERAIDSVNGGLGTVNNSVFFAFALLVPIATFRDRELVGALSTLPDRSADRIIGDLSHEAMPYMIANFFEGQNPSEIIEWINSLVDQMDPEDINTCSLFRAISLAMARGYLDPNRGIDAFVQRLRNRADKRGDLQSALIVCELMDLSAQKIDEVDALVRECFAREQIDASYVGIDSWDTTRSRLEKFGNKEIWADPAAELSSWCYEFLCDELDPVDAKFYANPSAFRMRDIEESAIPQWIAQIRESTDQFFPREAVRSLDSGFAAAYSAIVDLIREEVARYQQSDPKSWSGNGAYLGLVLTVTNSMPLPTDLMRAILQMPEEDRTRLLGDQFGLVVRSVAATPLRECDFVEQWIWDFDRSVADRREMVDFYPCTCRSSTSLDREEAIGVLVLGLRRALAEEPMLIAPYAENLALFSPKEHSEILEEAFSRTDVDWTLPLPSLRRMVQDVAFAKDQFKDQILSYRSYDRVISAGVMFDHQALQPKPLNSTPMLMPQTQQQESYASTTIRNDAIRVQRNDPCPCGSGKKYKKCCLTR